MQKKFKIIISAVLIGALIFACIFPYTAIEIKRYYGDINNDAFVTTDDARIALLIATGIYADDLSDIDFIAADMDGNKKIDTRDARLVLQTAAGIVKKEYMDSYQFSENSQEFVKRLNLERVQEDSNLSYLILSEELSEVARIAAKDYATKTGTAFMNSDGTYFNKLLDKQGVSYTLADKIIVTASFGYKEALETALENPQSRKALMSKNYNKIGIAAHSNDGRTFYWCIFLIKD